jgi:hypothetical protein
MIAAHKPPVTSVISVPIVICRFIVDLLGFDEEACRL